MQEVQRIAEQRRREKIEEKKLRCLVQILGKFLGFNSQNDWMTI